MLLWHEKHANIGWRPVVCCAVLCYLQVPEARTGCSSKDCQLEVRWTVLLYMEWPNPIMQLAPSYLLPMFRLCSNTTCPYILPFLARMCAL